MQVSARFVVLRASSIVPLAMCAVLLGACGSPEPKSMSASGRSKEYFAESEYGVKASPRVTTRRSHLPRGGGRDQLGKPYKVRGKMYYPKEDRNYRKVGLASWYGDAFHGRLTANGEVYDMTHLTGAHPTMPLPSYARVTNLENGSSLIVRVNDRGPYHEGRIIDLSRRAAELLDYTRTGTAKVKVEYVGRAPLHGRDDRYLMASYRPGAADPSDGLASGVMVAMAGPTPQPVRSPAGKRFPNLFGSQPGVDGRAVVAGLSPAPAATVELPDLGPIAPERPSLHAPEPANIPFAVATLSYAEERVARAASLAALERQAAMSPQDVITSWRRQHSAASDVTPVESYVAAGAFHDRAAAEQLAAVLSAYGTVQVTGATGEDGQAWYGVDIRSDGRHSVDELLEIAWANGAPDALPVRD